MFGAQTALQIGGAIIGGVSDTAQYNKKVGAINDEAAAINRSTIFKYQMTGLQQAQVEDRATFEAQDKKLALTEAKGTATAAAASGGVEGPSVDALLNGFATATGSDLSRIYLQRDNEILQGDMEKKGTAMDAKNRLVGLKNQIPEDPGLKIAGRFLSAALGVGQSYIQNTTKDPTAFLGRRFN